jgi:hypothetical protein
MSESARSVVCVSLAVAISVPPRAAPLLETSYWKQSAIPDRSTLASKPLTVCKTGNPMKIKTRKAESPIGNAKENRSESPISDTISANSAPKSCSFCRAFQPTLRIPSQGRGLLQTASASAQCNYSCAFRSSWHRHSCRSGARRARDSEARTNLSANYKSCPCIRSPSNRPCLQKSPHRRQPRFHIVPTVPDPKAVHRRRTQIRLVNAGRQEQDPTPLH